jgi:hypothetical protein
VVTVDIKDQDLKVTISGWDVVWSLKRGLTIPLAHVVGAEVESVAGKPGWRIVGTGIPRGFSAGWFRKQGKNEFWIARQSAEVVSIRLRDEKYARLVLQVDNPREVVDMVNAAVGTTRGHEA